MYKNLYKKFAHIDYVKNNDEIPIKLNSFIKKSEASLEWYVKTYNPFKASGMVVANENGYFIKLPITAEEAESDNEKAMAIIGNAIEALKDYNVEIVLPPKNPLFEDIRKLNMNVADGITIYPFFLNSAIKKIARRFGFNKNKYEILLLAGGKSITDSIIYNIYPETNFLSIMDNQNDLRIYDAITEKAFEDCGLNIKVSDYSKKSAGSADIIINVADNKTASLLDYSLKKNAVYFDLTGNQYEKNERMRKRKDLIMIDSLQINIYGEKISLAMFELAFYIKSREYRELCANGFDERLCIAIKKQITDINASIGAFQFVNNI